MYLINNMTNNKTNNLTNNKTNNMTNNKTNNMNFVELKGPGTLLRIQPKAGPEARFTARRHYCGYDQVPPRKCDLRPGSSIYGPEG
jgi:hypothetical protein